MFPLGCTAPVNDTDARFGGTSRGAVCTGYGKKNTLTQVMTGHVMILQILNILILLPSASDGRYRFSVTVSSVHLPYLYRVVL